MIQLTYIAKFAVTKIFHSVHKLNCLQHLSRKYIFCALMRIGNMYIMGTRQLISVRMDF
jgi:hypothetical protein